MTNAPQSHRPAADPHFDPYTAAPGRPMPRLRNPVEIRRRDRRLTSILVGLATAIHIGAVGLTAVTLQAVEMSRDAEVLENSAGLLTALAAFVLLGLAVWVLIVILSAAVSLVAAVLVWIRALVVHLPGGRTPWPEMLALTTTLMVAGFSTTAVGLVLLDRGFNEGLDFNMELYIGLGLVSVVLVLGVALGCIVSGLRGKGLTR